MKLIQAEQRKLQTAPSNITIYVRWILQRILESWKNIWNRFSYVREYFYGFTHLVPCCVGQHLPAARIPGWQTNLIGNRLAIEQCTQQTAKDNVIAFAKVFQPFSIHFTWCGSTCYRI